jgi:tetratricopeptide (TPR) repeat protein
VRRSILPTVLVWAVAASLPMLVLADDDARWETLNRDGMAAAAAADWSAAEAAFRGALEALGGDAEGRPAPVDGVSDDDARLAVVAGNLAVALLEQGELEEARELFERALLIRRAVFGTRDAALAESLNNLAELERRMGRLERARSLHEAALEVRREVLEPGHPDIAESLNNLGVLLRDIGELDEAARLVDEAHALRLERLGPAHRATLESAGNLATIAIDRADLDSADAALQAAIAAVEDGGDPNGVPPYLRRIAVDVLLLRDDVDGALALCDERLPASQDPDGPDQYDVSSLELPEVELIAACARAIGRAGDPQRATALLTDSLARSTGLGEPAIEAELRWELADTLASTGELSAAESELDSVVALLQSMRDPRLALALNNRASIRFERGRPLAAAEDLEAATAALEGRGEAAERPLLRDVLANYAVVLRSLDRNAEALEVENRVIDLATAMADEAAEVQAE